MNINPSDTAKGFDGSHNPNPKYDKWGFIYISDNLGQHKVSFNTDISIKANMEEQGWVGEGEQAWTGQFGVYEDWKLERKIRKCES